MRYPAFSSLRTRLTLSYLAVIVVAMSLSGFLLLSLLERYFLQAMEQSLLAQAQITAQALIPGAVAAGQAANVPSSAFNTVQQQSSNFSLSAQNAVVPSGAADPGTLDFAYLSNASLQLSSQLDTRIRILDAQGVVRTDSRGQDHGRDLAADPVVAQALAGRQATLTGREATGSTMSLALPVQAGGRLLGVVYLSQPLRDVTAVLNDLRLRWLLSTLAAVALAGVAGLLLSRAVARPLRQLTDAAGTVAAGRLDAQVPVRSRDELGRLGQAFNEMTSRLRAARQAQVDLVANVSHELRTPLTAIKGMVETLRDGAVDDPEVRDRFLATVEGEADRLTRLVNDLLVLSRADSDALDLHFQAVDLKELAEATAACLELNLQARQVTVQIDAAADLPPAWGDCDRIGQVLTNLLDNAVKYSPSGATVTVCLSAAPEAQVRVEVQDRGPGIPAADLARIGERFYRADKARSRAEGGTGLGLAIAQTLLQAHNSQLHFDSREGHGTSVSFTLPSAP